MEQVRVIKLPKCKMVCSGVQKNFDFSENGELGKFGYWWTEKDKNRHDKFFARDFLWYDAAADGLNWGYFVYDGLDTDGYEVIDFEGGYYAVASYKDGDEKDNMNTYNYLVEWAKNSNGFDFDTSRPGLGQIVSPPDDEAKKALGYEQMDCYVPIKIRADGICG